MLDIVPDTSSLSPAEQQKALLIEQRAQWLIKAQSGDDEAKAQLYESYRENIYAYLRSRPDSDHETVEDVTQTVLLRLWSYDISKFRDRGDGLTPLVIASAKNAWLDNRTSAYQRLSKPTGDIELYGAYFPLTTHREDKVEEDIDNRKRLEDIIGKIATYVSEEDVNPDTMTAMLLFADGYTIAEIAELQHATLTTIRQRIFRARSQLRRILSNDT